MRCQHSNERPHAGALGSGGGLCALAPPEEGPNVHFPPSVQSFPRRCPPNASRAGPWARWSVQSRNPDGLPARICCDLRSCVAHVARHRDPDLGQALPWHQSREKARGTSSLNSACSAQVRLRTALLTAFLWNGVPHAQSPVSARALARRPLPKPPSGTSRVCCPSAEWPASRHRFRRECHLCRNYFPRGTARMRPEATPGPEHRSRRVSVSHLG